MGRLKDEKCEMFVLTFTVLAKMRTYEVLTHIFWRVYSLYFSSILKKKQKILAVINC